MSSRSLSKAYITRGSRNVNGIRGSQWSYVTRIEGESLTQPGRPRETSRDLFFSMAGVYLIYEKLNSGACIMKLFLPDRNSTVEV